MKKSFVILLVVVSFFVSLGLISETKAQRNQVVSNPTATPKPKPKRKFLAEIQEIELDKDQFESYCPTNDFIHFENAYCKDKDFIIQVKTKVRNPKNKPLNYEYKVSGGKITGQGENVIWELKNVRPGKYTITVSLINGGKISQEIKAKEVLISECSACDPPCVCPNLVVTGGGGIKGGETVDFTANVSSGTAYDIKYNWTVSQGEIISDQGTPNITVKTTSAMSGNITATVEINGVFCAECVRTASETATIIQ